MPTFTMRQLLEAGVHFGHTTRRWNPKMKPFIFGKRGGVHILDLQQTVPLLYRALDKLKEVATNNGRILFVGSKRAATEIVYDTADKTGQYYVNHRWLGGMMTNWKTISQSIDKLKALEAELSGDTKGLTKKEILGKQKSFDKLDRVLGGIRNMGNLPDLIVVIDTNKEAIAIQEANILKIPVIAIIDSNSNPENIDYPIPGNDDAIRSIDLYCSLFTDAIVEGMQISLGSQGVDVGASETVVETTPIVETAKVEPVKETVAEVKKEVAKKTETEVKTAEKASKE